MAIEEELKKQESLLNHLHEELMKVKDMEKEEQLWEVQRVVTQLKRQVKMHCCAVLSLLSWLLSWLPTWTRYDEPIYGFD